MEFDDSFDDDIDENLLRNLPLDFPFEEEQQKECTDVDSGIGSNDVDVSPMAEHPVDVPEDFPFPFQPYDIQVGFMKNLYRSLELGKIGIFESPTGTGKSLSLICGALRWLKDHEERKRQELEQLLQEKPPPVTIKQEPKEPAPGEDWITAFARKQEEEEASKKLQDEREQRIRREERLKHLRDNLKPNPKFKRKRDKLEEAFEDLFKDAPREVKEMMKQDLENTSDVTSQDNQDDDHIVVEEYTSDDEGRPKDEKEEDEEDLNEHVTKIYFCSRTHSQLAQFVREVQKSPYGDDTRVVTLGSRQNLCINEAVKRLKSLSLINDRCLELQKHKTGSKKKKDGESVTKKKKVPTATLR